MPSRSPAEAIPAEAFLDSYPPPIRSIAETLRLIVRRAMPDAVERVRSGWRLIGYDLPIGTRAVYFAYVAPEIEHIHLGFEHGVWMDDPHGALLGAGITRQVRWLTFRPGEPIDAKLATDLVREAARVALIPRSAR